MSIFGISNIESGARALKVQNPCLQLKLISNSYHFYMIYAIPIAATKKTHIKYVKTTIRKE